ncbi:hypothetical protein VNO78_03231 [Psophocarpus tetragonolobus]|uniref:Pectinesterase n=1 Tax=Psophocarpus tetragonolobus TaxID=3891 RepID=A0AAN9TCV4_PSOTE
MVIFLTKQLRSSISTITFIIIFLFLFASSEFAGLRSLNVSPSKFIRVVRKVGDDLQKVTSMFKSELSNAKHDPLLFNLISTCLDLLDLSVDQLNWSISAVQSPKGNHNSTGDMKSDLRTWLSAVLANVETCTDSFEDTKRNVKGSIATKIDEAKSLLQDLLTQVKPSLNDLSMSSRSKFPSWVEQRDKKLLGREGVRANAVVAVDGSGNFTKVMDAVNAAPDKSMIRYVIHIKKGVYIENVVIGMEKWNLMMIGDGMDATVITGNLSVNVSFTTFRTATFGVNGRGFIAQDLTFENTAGPNNHQAVALRSNSDLSIFFRCGIYGYQDSLYAHTSRQFYRECKISGTVDFIFGRATVVFQNCTILARKGLESQKNTITAQGEKHLTESSGFSFQFCNISADHDLVPFVNTTSTYLGRPWKAYSRTIFMSSYISDVLNPKGWLEWNGTLYLNTLYYAEYDNYGPGARLDGRVKWPGYHVIDDPTKASNFTVANLIEGNIWLPSTGVPFIP